jgi:Fur family iron response transcriptional regulator
LEIASILLAQPQHLSADELLARVNGHARVSKATIYNTLALFARKGLVREVIVDPSKVFYDSNTAPHHHLYNVSTGELTDICGVHVDVPSMPELPEGTQMDGVDVIVRVRSK